MEKLDLGNCQWHLNMCGLRKCETRVLSFKECVQPAPGQYDEAIQYHNKHLELAVTASGLPFWCDPEVRNRLRTALED